MRAAIMRLRNDPAVSATMAGAFTQTNAAQLASALGRQPSEGELYIAHFLGSDGAAKLIGAADKPAERQRCSDVSASGGGESRAYSSNKSGQPRSVSEVYSTLTGRFEVARATAFGPALRGSASRRTPDPAGVAQAFAQANARPLAIPVPVPAVPPDTRPLFQSMFTDRGNRAVTQTVSNLWTPAGVRCAGRQQPAAHAQFVQRPARGHGASRLGGKI